MTTNVFVAILLLRPAVRSVEVMNEYRLTYSLDSQCSFVNSAIKTLPSASAVNFHKTITNGHISFIANILDIILFISIVHVASIMLVH